MTKSILPTTMNSLKYIKAQDLYKCIKNGYKTPSDIKGYSKTDPTSTIDIGEGEDVVIVDMRGDDFIGGHIKGCINIPYSDFRRYDSETGDYINIYNFIKGKHHSERVKEHKHNIPLCNVPAKRTISCTGAEQVLTGKRL
ncbi:unnamed protein product [Hanseniaspora opuntiae]